MGQVQAGDFKLYHEVQGSGEPLLMILGLGSSSTTWSPVLVTELSRHFQTIVYDNRGTGQSDKPAISACHAGRDVQRKSLSILDG